MPLSEMHHRCNSIMSQLGINRRSFIRALGASTLALPAIHCANSLLAVKANALEGAVGELLSPEAALALRDRLLHLVNEERARYGLSAVEIDDLACRVAADHARDMADGVFLSHWGRDGLKPYQRYSFSGGVDATAENVGAIDHTFPVSADEAVSDVLLSHISMYNETPPNDGHRKTILTPQHTHVGFGFAADGSHVRLSELFVSRYVIVDEYAAKRPRATSFLFKGRVARPKLTVQAIDVFYEPPPAPADLLWLRQPKPYSLPSERVTLFPRLEGDFHYQDGSRGDIELRAHGKFSVWITLGKPAGIYTVVVWLRRGKHDQAFPATEVCIIAE